MVKVGKWIAKFRGLILAVAVALLIPSFYGMIQTRTNYDLLSYLPETLETVDGQNIMVDEYGMGAFSMLVVEGMELKDVQKLEEEISKVDHVEDVLWYDDVADITLPVEMIPKRLREAFFMGDATMMLVLLDDTTSSDAAMEAVYGMRRIVDERTFISGMSGIVTDIKDLALQELPVYVVIAVVLCLIILLLTTRSFLVPVLFLLSIGFAIVYNLGSNYFLGEISYITKALSAVLQLGVTMDYSIFLLDSYEENKLLFPKDRNEAMGHAITSTFKSILGSSITTIAGFVALCFMTFTLGRDIGIVAAKGVIMGVICCVTVLPALILTFDRLIEKTKHRPLFKNTDRLSSFVVKHYRIWLAVFLVLLYPAIYGNNHTEVYYDIARSLPETLDSNIANAKLKDEFQMSTLHLILMDRELDAKDKRGMMSEIDEADGVKWTISMSSLLGPTVPESMVPEDIRGMLQSDRYELAFVCSEYSSATPEVNAQIAAIDEIAKSYDSGAMVIGEAPLMKDLEDVTSVDLVHVNTVSIGAIFLIILLTFKSISLPIILVAVIEFAITVNMAVPFYQNVSLPFVASVVIGTVQLGATVDYAILMTSRYQKERQAGKAKKEAALATHKACTLSILTSGISFFAATYGVAAYSQVDMIGSICTLLARGALISMVVVLTVLPALFLVFDRVICATSIHFLGKKNSGQPAAAEAGR